MARIPQHFIDELLERVDIVDLIDSRVPLKKKGSEYAACCPFHTEKTPSFYVVPDKQFYHCFGCGAHGTALSFLMEFDHLDFRDAVQDLADRVGLEIPTEASAPSPDPDGHLRAALAHADDYFRRQLRQSEAAKAYLQGRRVSGKTAARFGLGYAPDQWSGLLDSVDSDARREALLSTGMLVRKDSGRFYDRFRGRVMFPIRDSRGRTIAFGGRVIGEAQGPKYYNSPEHPLFHKGRELYGLYEARQALRSIPRLLVVEGYMDVIALAEAGIHWAVATLGTATTPDHLDKAFRITREVVCCFDGDRAGRQAAWRALENALPALRAGREVRFLFLPEGEDPDSMVRREGADAFQQRVAGAESLSRWMRRHLSEDLDLGTAEGRAALVEKARPLLARVRDRVYRELLSDELADAAGLDPARWAAMLADATETAPSSKPAPDTAAPTRPRIQRPAPLQIRLTPVREALAILLQSPRIATRVAEQPKLATLDLPGADTLAKMLEICRAEPEIRTATLLERWRGEQAHPHLEKLATTRVPGEDEDLARHLDAILARLTGPRAIAARMTELLDKAASDGLDQTEKEELRALQQARAAQEKAG
ncbi:DNA primase [Gammaproteobacteria bacterium AB-CW1]|uniref:DNA primase n=1 Tax=Natronospira elongata TaxID=3110268 RepID=A0AAP6MLF8_9GAMM|nr:DNA primase [Gammaproteobacteria bacterium AB-CW1]